MIKNIKRLYDLLTHEQRFKLLRLQFLVFFMALSEVAGVAAIGPFMALVGDMDRLHSEGYIRDVYQLMNFSSPEQFLFWVGVFVLVTLTLAAVFSIYTTWKLSLYAQQVGAEISVRLYIHYMTQPWLFHASVSSVVLTNKIALECNRITNQIIQPLMIMNAKFGLVILMLIMIFLLNPLVALAGLGVFGIAYFILYRYVRHFLGRNGVRMSESNRQRLALMNEGFGGIKDTLLLGRQNDFSKRFELASNEFGYAQGVNRGLSHSPRYAMELIAFSAIIFLVLYLLSAFDGDLGGVLPLLSVYALAGFKLLPAFQQIYVGVAAIKGNMSAYENLESDLIASQEVKTCQGAKDVSKLPLEDSISLNNIVFSYPNQQSAALNYLNIYIPVNKVIGLVGSSGSGKSTAVDVILGLIEPEEGGLLVDGEVVNKRNLRAWQNNIGFVPQTIFLADATIKENIAFGLPIDEIDRERVAKAAEMAHLNEFVQRLPEGLETRVGERGVKLSGGQRQRIGIARALYDDANVLVLDEATSALDGITEQKKKN
eukprot:gnl/Carplike_NY0171/2286_a3081_430.p1 GENE.gnl/Carplike_NY0171/2286_a3081_430~~gnl/Carplike_NY0171/2286_a3081_430.p1  ORF type:complete len:541 (-),score=1.97 gnl/Carplike_NY0171/2286_a3081_430:41-1663(-)